MSEKLEQNLNNNEEKEAPKEPQNSPAVSDSTTSEINNLKAQIEDLKTLINLKFDDFISRNEEIKTKLSEVKKAEAKEDEELPVW